MTDSESAAPRDMTVKEVLQGVEAGDRAAVERVPDVLKNGSATEEERAQLLNLCFSLAKAECPAAVEALAEIARSNDESGIVALDRVAAAHALVLCVKKGHEQALEEAANCLIPGVDDVVSSQLARAVSEAAKRGMERAVVLLEERWDGLTKECSLAALEGLSAAAGRGNISAMDFLSGVWLGTHQRESSSKADEESASGSDDGGGGAKQGGKKMVLSVDVTHQKDDAEVLRVAGDGLVLAAQRGNEHAIDMLLGAVDDESADVRLVALNGLAGTASRVGHKGAMEFLHNRLSHPDEQVRKIAAKAFEAAAFEGHEHAFDLLTSELDREDGHHLVAASALGIAAREGFERAIAALACRAPLLGDEARLVAVRGLAGAAAGTDEGGSERAVDVLFGLLTDPHEEVQLVVFDGLAAAAARGHEQAAQVLAAEVNRLPDKPRTAVVHGLASAAELGNEWLVDVLFKLMEDPNEAVRTAALEGMQACVARNSERAIALIIANTDPMAVPPTISEDAEDPEEIEEGGSKEKGDTTATKEATE